MRRILFFILIIISVQSFGQSNYTFINGRYRWLATVADSGLHVPRYNGVPSGLRNGVYVADGLIAMDTTNGYFYGYRNGAWFKVANYADIGNRFGKAGEDVRFGEDRTPSGIGTYGLKIDSLADFWVGFKTSSSKTVTFFDYETTKTRFLLDIQKSALYSPNQATNFRAYNDTAFIELQSTASKWLVTNLASGVGTKSLRYDPSSGRITYADTTTGGSSGTVNTGASLKAAYYPSAGTTVDDVTGVEYNNTNLLAKFSTQATTDVGIEVKAASSQTANLQNYSSSSGTGDLGSYTKDGYLKTNRIGLPASVAPSYSIDIQDANSGVTSLQISDPSAGQYRLKIRDYASTIENFSSNFVIYNASLSGTLSMGGYGSTNAIVLDDKRLYFNVRSAEKQGADVASSAGAITLGTAGNTFEITGTAAITLISSNDWQNGSKITLLFTSTASLVDGTANSGTDIGIETGDNANFTGSAGASITLVLSEIGGTQRWREIGRSVPIKPSLNKGVFIASPTSADTIDVWQTPVAITITSLKAILRGSSSPSVTYNIGFGTDIQSPTAVFTSNITCTSITTGCSNSSGFNDATIPAGSFIWVYTTAQSGTVRSIAFTINYTED